MKLAPLIGIEAVAFLLIIGETYLFFMAIVPLGPVPHSLAVYTAVTLLKICLTFGLGILWLALSVFRLLPGVLLWSFFRHGGAFLPFGVPMFVHGLLRIVGMLFLASAAIGIAAGWGLLERRPWARTLAIVVAFMNLTRCGPLGGPRLGWNEK
jgi:hypothetical protein